MPVQDQRQGINRSREASRLHTYLCTSLRHLPLPYEVYIDYPFTYSST
jgi:hypothetical protein